MPLKTEETFQLHAPADRVWAFLVDPRQVVTCLPGAELTAVQDESTFLSVGARSPRCYAARTHVTDTGQPSSAIS